MVGFIGSESDYIFLILKIKTHQNKTNEAAEKRIEE
jgi:hypothetical protein